MIHSLQDADAHVAKRKIKNSYMHSHLLLTLSFFAFSSFLDDSNQRHSRATKNMVDFTVHRLSNERVFVSWHTIDDPKYTTYELLRKHTKRDSFVSVAVVAPKFFENNTADYSFTDSNSFPDSSFYCLKKTNTDSVIFYSLTKGIEGAARQR